MNILEDIMKLIDISHISEQNISSEIEEYIDGIKDCDCECTEDFTEDIGECVSKVWEEPVIKQAYQETNSIGIGENADYFFEKVKQFADDDYELTDEDILKAHIRTFGIHNLKLEIGKRKSKTIITDVGNQKNERRTWASVFNNVTFVMFVVSLSDFDQVMLEDKETTRTEDSINMFTSIASSQQFKNVPIYLIFNKYDIFTQKLKKHPEAFRKAYPGFEGDTNNEYECIEHVKKTYMEHITERERDAWIEPITTCAMDQLCVKYLFKKIAKKIVEKVEANL